MIIPCLDAAATAGDVAGRARAFTETVLVVDDGSSDDTAGVAIRAGAQVVRHEVNRGKGAALLTGLFAAEDLGFTHVVTLDGDGQHDPKDIPLLLSRASEHPGAIVVGARDFSVPNVPRASRFGRSFSNFWVWLETGVRLSDTQSGYRVYPVSRMVKLSLKPSRFEWEVEVLVRASWAGIGVQEVPITAHYPPPDQRISHYRGFHDSALISLLHFKLVPLSLIRR